tara:strand:+ start:817 stop:1008 length:192 start_codon:yes stop_codon:yes gene_type:complete
MITQYETDEIIRAYFHLKVVYDELAIEDTEVNENHATVVQIMNKHKQYAWFFLTEDEQDTKEE